GQKWVNLSLDTVYFTDPRGHKHHPCFLLLFFISALISFFTALYCLYCSLFKAIFISRSLSSFKLHSAFIFENRDVSDFLIAVNPEIYSLLIESTFSFCVSLS